MWVKYNYLKAMSSDKKHGYSKIAAQNLNNTLQNFAGARSLRSKLKIYKELDKNRRH